MELDSLSNMNKKVQWAIGLSATAILLCLLIIGLWIFDVFHLAVVSAETFIGVCVALLGVIVTMAVGSQIVNVMELKSAQKTYEKELKGALETIKSQQFQIEADRIHNAHLQHCTMAMIAEFQGHYPQAVYYFFGALLTGLQMQVSLGNEKFVLDHIKICLDKCKEWSNMPLQWHTDLKNIDATIKLLPNYRWIKDKYEPLRNDYFSKIKLNID